MAPSRRQQSTDLLFIPSSMFPEPEDRGRATMSPLGDLEYVEDLVRPGRILVVAAEESTGKSFAMAELAHRVAVAGGSFAGSWPVLQTGPVLYLSEMHADDDYLREELVLASLGRVRSDLTGRYYRLPLATAAGGRPALMVREWRDYATRWLRDRHALLLIVDTATGATRVDPWGPDILEVYAVLRAMLGEYPELAIVLLIHLKKPSRRGDRQISDVLGEWGRWCDVVLLMENDGLDRVRLTLRKRVRRERQILAKKVEGLLVEPVEREAANSTRIPPSATLQAITAEPGLTYAELGSRLKVSPDTATRYVRNLGAAVTVLKGTARSGPGAKVRIYPVAASPHVTARDPRGEPSAEGAPQDVESPHRRSTPMGAAAPPAETAVDPSAIAVSDEDVLECDMSRRRRWAVPGRVGQDMRAAPRVRVAAKTEESSAPPAEAQAGRS